MEDYWSPGTGGDPLVPRAECFRTVDVAPRTAALSTVHLRQRGGLLIRVAEKHLFNRIRIFENSKFDFFFQRKLPVSRANSPLS